MTSRSFPVQEILDAKSRPRIAHSRVPLDHSASDADLTSPGLALAGHTVRIPHGRMWVFSETEMTYVETLSDEIGNAVDLRVFQGHWNLSIS